MISGKWDHHYMTEIPIGYRFKPTDEQIILYYLSKKSKGEMLPYDIIRDLEIYGDIDKEPWEFFGETSSETFYVFTKLKKKGKGRNIDRIAGSGTWKDQRKDVVKDSKDNIIGFKKLLVFKVKGSDDSTNSGKGHWIMHEYSLLNDQSDYVLCTIRNKDGSVDDDEPPRKRMKTGYSVEDDQAASTVPTADYEKVLRAEYVDDLMNFIESNYCLFGYLLESVDDKLEHQT